MRIIPGRRRPLRLGVVGCGRVFERHHLPALRATRDWELLAVCEPAHARREWFHSVFPRRIPLFDSLPEFLSTSELDALLITTPPATHARLTIQALEAGLHVLVEKPMALSPGDAHAMAEVAQRVRKQLWVGFNRRFLRSYGLLRKRLRAAPNGSIRTVRCTLSTDPTRWSSVTGYRGNDAAGGGVLDDLVSHQLDLLPWMLDLELREVSAMSQDKGSSRLEHVHCELRFANGFVATCEAVHGGEYAERVEVSLEDRAHIAHWHGGLETVRVRSGEPQPAGSDLAPRRRRRRGWLKRRDAMNESFASQLTAFAAAIRGRAEPIEGAQARSGAINVEAVAACRESLRQGGAWIPLRSGGDLS